MIKAIICLAIHFTVQFSYSQSLDRPNISSSILRSDTLLVEVYNYANYLKIWDNEYNKAEDSKTMRKFYKYALERQKSLVKKYKGPYKFVEKDSINIYPAGLYPFLLMAEYKIIKRPSHLNPNKDGNLAGWKSTKEMLIIDRRKNIEFRWIDKRPVFKYFKNPK